MNLSLHPAAEADIEEAAQFYEREASPALAARFVAEFGKLTKLLTDHPEIGSPRAKGRRGLCMNVFPYTVIYRHSVQDIRILVVKHDRKRPGYGQSRT